jgi:hypothetical protein
MGETIRTRRKPGRPRIPGLVRCNLHLTSDHVVILRAFADAEGVSESQALRNMLDREYARATSEVRKTLRKVEENNRKLAREIRAARR